MDLRELIRKAKQTAKTSDEVLLARHFEDYLDLLQMRGEIRKEDLPSYTERLNQSLAILRAAADKVVLNYGLNSQQLADFFANPGSHPDAEIIQSMKNASESSVPRSQKLRKRTNKNLRV